MSKFDQLLQPAATILAQVSPVGLRNLIRVAQFEPSGDVETIAMVQSMAGMRTMQVIRYNPKFIEEKIDTPMKLAALLLHEAFHKLFNHFRIMQTPRESNIKLESIPHIAADWIINATICKLHPPMRELFNSLYDRRTFPDQLLRPGGIIHDPLLAKLNRLVWRSPNRVSLEQLIKMLSRYQPLIDDPAPALLGNLHQTGLDDDLADKLADDMLKALKSAGFSEHEIYQQLKNIKKQKSFALEDAFRQAMIKSEVGRITREVAGGVTEDDRTILPIHYGTKELLLMAAGAQPLFYPTHASKSKEELGAVHVYVDVSGSMAELYEIVYGAILNLAHLLPTSVYLFSNKVEEISIEEMEQGIIKTTGGTDFDCIAKHLASLKQGAGKMPDKAVIFTDGYASMGYANRKMVGELGVEIIGVLTPDGSDRDLREFCKRCIWIKDLGNKGDE